MKWPTLVIALTLAFLQAANATDSKRLLEPPANFLQTSDPGWQRLLHTKITGDYHDTTLSDLMEDIGRQGRQNFATIFPGSGMSSPSPVSRITIQFRHVPLRTVYYQISRQLGL